MRVYFCRKCHKDAKSRGNACVHCGSRPRIPRSGRQSLKLSRSASDDEAAKLRKAVPLDQAIHRARESTQRKQKLKESAEPKKFARKGYLSEEEILDLWQQHHGKLSRQFVRDFLTHPRLRHLLTTRGKFVRAAIPMSPKLEVIADEALRTSREAEQIRRLQEAYSAQQAAEAWVDPRDFSLGPMARTWITHRQENE